MTYVVYARKYRPQRFQDVIGQDQIVDVLKSGIKNNRIPHAMLFSGPRGVGKTSAARILAMALNCTNLNDGEPCLKCDSCRDIIDGRDIDVIEIDGASNRGIDEIRDLREKARYAASSGKYKIFIIDEVHMLTKEAFNALLKILEEPPEHVKFIFATTEPYNVIPTILSRCQRFDFKRLSVLDIVEQLEIICHKEKKQFETEGLKLIAMMADGGMRDALSILDQISSLEQTITYDNINIMFGRLDSMFFAGFTDLIIRKDIKGLITSLDDILIRGYDLETFISEFAYYMHRILLVKNEIKTEDVLVMQKELFEKAKMQSESFSNTSIMQITKELIELSSKLKFASNKRIVVENQLARIPFMIEAKDIDEIIRYFKQYSAGIPVKKADMFPQKKSERIEEAKPKINDRDSILSGFISHISENEVLLSEAIKNGIIKDFREDTFIIEVPESYKEYIKYDKLQKYLDTYNPKIKFEFIFDNKKGSPKLKNNSLEDEDAVVNIVALVDGEIIN